MNGRGRGCVIAVELLVVLALILLNGVFSGAEIAVLSIRKTRLQELVDEGSQGALSVALLRQDPERFLATVQVGITVIGATAAAFGGSSVAARLEPLLAALPVIGERSEQLALVIVVAGVSYLSLVLGELVPKSLALRAAEPYAMLIGRPLSALSFVARPVVFALTTSSNLVLRLFGDKTSFTESRLSPEELQQLVEEAAAAGMVDEHAGEIAARALTFSDLDVMTVMVPKPEIVSVSKQSTLDDLAEVAIRSGHTRVLVWGNAPDDLLGFVNLREILARGRKEPGLTIEQALHPIPFVPTSMPAPLLLRDLQRRRMPLAAVVDEQGTLRGLVTVEDLVEELVGEILSEGDRKEEPSVKESDGSFIIDASTPVHAINRDLGLTLPEGDFATIGGLVLSLAGRIPAVGERFRTEAHEIEVTEATHRKIKTVRVRPSGAPFAAAEG